jgi:hypothetical protein
VRSHDATADERELPLTIFVLLTIFYDQPREYEGPRHGHVPGDVRRPQHAEQLHPLGRVADGLGMAADLKPIAGE